MSRTHYAYEKLMIAVDAMVVLEQPLSGRLQAAYMAFHTLNPADFDDIPGANAKFTSVRNCYSKIDDRENGSAFASVQAINELQRRELAHQIFSLFLRVAEADANEWSRSEADRASRSRPGL